MEAYVKRMMEEKIQLKERIDRLNIFIFVDPIYADLSQENKDLLCEQLLHMEKYFDVLSQRITLETE